MNKINPPPHLILRFISWTSECDKPTWSSATFAIWGISHLIWHCKLPKTESWSSVLVMLSKGLILAEDSRDNSSALFQNNGTWSFVFNWEDRLPSVLCLTWNFAVWQFCTSSVLNWNVRILYSNLWGWFDSTIFRLWGKNTAKQIMAGNYRSRCNGFECNALMEYSGSEISVQYVIKL